MAYGIVHYFEGGTAEQYQNTVAVVHPDGGATLPAGQTYHAAGVTPDGFVVVAIWDSEDDYVKFRDESLLPGFASVENALPGPPDETTFEVHRTQSS
ncbi:MAG: hypothetical protein ACHQIG_05140 [Acidimicrobiia bacterium]